MRLAFLDEAGISGTSQEPHTVVAGVLVEPDRQWKVLREYYHDLARDLFPDEDPYNFVFHAKDVWHGSGVFSRDQWPLKERMKIFGRLMQVPRLFELPVFYGAINNDSYNKAYTKVVPQAERYHLSVNRYAEAFVSVISDIDAWLVDNTIDEVAMITAEDTQQVKNHIKMIHEGYSDIEPILDGEFKTKRIVDSVNYVQKKESILLQIADHCAFTIRRKLNEGSHIDPYFSYIAGQIRKFDNMPERLKLRLPINAVSQVQ